MEERKLKELLSDMSIEEKIDQLLQVTGYYFEEEGVVTGPNNQAGFMQQEVDLAGSVLGIAGADKLIGIQKKYMEKQPHQIPLLFMADIINGFRTIFPIPLAQGCSFDPEIAKAGAEVAAKESAVSGLHLTFSPMVDLVRDPRWGRVMESTGEDPYLNSEFARAMVRGYQGVGQLSEPYKIAACVKHFAGYGAPMAGREYNTVELSNRTLFDSYLPAYQAAIDAGCATAMTSFNTLDRIPSTANKWLMRDILRTHMGFEGVLISDWAAIEEIIHHGVAEGKKQAARLALEAGVDIDMMTTCYCRNIKELMVENKIDSALLDEAVYRVLVLKNRLGLFENPFKDANSQWEEDVILSKEHRKLARQAAAQTMVLLKNEDQILPLKKEGQKIAFIGPHADSPYLMGVWSIFGRMEDVITIKEGVRRAGVTEASFYRGAPVVSDLAKLELHSEIREQIESDIKASKDLLKEALLAAQDSDIVVLALGEHPTQSGEAASRTNLHLDALQLELLRQVKKINSNIVTVLLNGRPLIIEDVLADSKAVLEAWLPGTEGGNAIADILFGDVTPSGKLSMSFPRTEGQIPIYYNDFPTGRPVLGKKEKYLSQYIDCPNEPLFPFGYGLSYTAFEISPITLSHKILSGDGSIQASVSVRNTGYRAGAQVIQLYIKDEVGSVSRPNRELKGFQKIYLESGEEAEVIFDINTSMLKFYDNTMQYVCEPGSFKLFIGADSATENSVPFTVE
jgi:beta-glucosidase